MSPRGRLGAQLLGVRASLAWCSERTLFIYGLGQEGRARKRKGTGASTRKRAKVANVPSVSSSTCSGHSQNRNKSQLDGVLTGCQGSELRAPQPSYHSPHQPRMQGLLFSLSHFPREESEAPREVKPSTTQSGACSG